MRGKPNYRFGRAERDRVKKAKREDKLKSRQERAASREPEAPPTPRDERRDRGRDDIARHQIFHRRSSFNGRYQSPRKLVKTARGRGVARAVHLDLLGPLA